MRSTVLSTRTLSGKVIDKLYIFNNAESQEKGMTFLRENHSDNVIGIALVDMMGTSGLDTEFANTLSALGVIPDEVDAFVVIDTDASGEFAKSKSRIAARKVAAGIIDDEENKPLPVNSILDEIGNLASDMMVIYANSAEYDDALLSERDIIISTDSTAKDIIQRTYDIVVLKPIKEIAISEERADLVSLSVLWNKSSNFTDALSGDHVHRMRQRMDASFFSRCKDVLDSFTLGKLEFPISDDFINMIKSMSNEEYDDICRMCVRPFCNPNLHSNDMAEKIIKIDKSRTLFEGILVIWDYCFEVFGVPFVLDRWLRHDEPDRKWNAKGMLDIAKLIGVESVINAYTNGVSLEALTMRSVR